MGTIIPPGIHVTYQFQRRRCGRDSCLRCRSGDGHGPYWYAYWRGSDGTFRSGYIGKQLPPGVELTARQRERARCEGEHGDGSKPSLGYADNAGSIPQKRPRASTEAGERTTANDKGVGCIAFFQPDVNAS
jgi:hypothetical protein